MKHNQKIPLPIDQYLEAIFKKIMQHPNLFLKANPGSGKTTRLPWFLASKIDGKVIVLEPRRLAAKMAAERIANEEKKNIGEEIGYHFRFEKKTSPESKLVFYTEGTFLKLIENDPTLKDVAVVILDEFHERHLETDIALAYLLSLQTKRPDLKLIIMSATLDIELKDKIPNSGLIEIEAPHYPVSINYLPNIPSELNRSMEQKIKNTLHRRKTNGDVLIFAPGMREMLKIKEYLKEDFGHVYLLHSEISKEEQQAAFEFSQNRKIILATSIAESSITITGITCVIDLGIQRSGVYSPWNGLKYISDTPTTKASAIQRAGRAGRTAPGECFRLYSEQDYLSREDHTVPEILTADLVDIYLLSLCLSEKLFWPTPPPIDRWNKAKSLSQILGLVDKGEKLTEIGKKSLNYPVDARLGRILVAGEGLHQSAKNKLVNLICNDIEKDFTGRLLKKFNTYLHHQVGTSPDWQKAMLTGFIDQSARFRQKQNDFIHFSGKTIKAHPSLALHDEYYLILNITQKQEAIQVIPIEVDWFYELEPFPLTENFEIEIDEKFRIKNQIKLGSIVIEESEEKMQWNSLPDSEKVEALALGEKYFHKKFNQWKETEIFGRLFFWSKINEMDMNKAISSINMRKYLESLEQLNWDEAENYFEQILMQELKAERISQWLPLTMNFGARRDMKIHYSEQFDPFVEAPIQDFYGVKSTPLIAENFPLTLKLLGPHKRPIQITKDLSGFWNKTYQELKKELMREYPRHNWPDNPQNAKPYLLKSHLPKI